MVATSDTSLLCYSFIKLFPAMIPKFGSQMFLLPPLKYERSSILHKYRFLPKEFMIHEVKDSFMQ